MSGYNFTTLQAETKAMLYPIAASILAPGSFFLPVSSAGDRKKPK
jgi:hypothetical protein